VAFGPAEQTVPAFQRLHPAKRFNRLWC
jgi:hypothetical protein